MHSCATLKLKVTSWSIYVIFFISACICPTAMIVWLFRKDFRSGNSFQLSPFAWPPCLTLKLNVTSWSTWHNNVISACICVTAMIFYCFVRFLDQGIHSNYCHSRDSYVWLYLPWLYLLYFTYLLYLPWNSRSCHGLTWHLLFLGTCMCPTAMIFCFVRFSGQGIYSDYCHLRDHHVWPWNVRSRHGLRVLTTWPNKMSRRHWRDLRFQGQAWRSRNWQ